MSMVEVRVPNLDCEGCASKLKKALFKLKGVEEVEAEIEIQKITVKGYGLEEKKVIKAIKRAGKASEPWPFPGYNSHYAAFYKYPTYIVNHYYDIYSNKNNYNSNGNGNSNSNSNSNRYMSGSSNSANGVHTFFHTPSLYSVAVSSDEAIASLFSDDNPHACSIM